MLPNFLNYKSELLQIRYSLIVT